MDRGGEQSVSDGLGGDRVIVALDVKTEAAARAVVASLGDACHAYKIGLGFLTAQGPGLARELVSAGKSVFLDLKLFEIPASVASAVEVALAGRRVGWARVERDGHARARSGGVYGDEEVDDGALATEPTGCGARSIKVSAAPW